MALGGKGVSASAGDGLSGCDSGLSSGFASLQCVDLFDGINLNIPKSVNYTKVVGAAASFNPLTTVFTFTGGNQSMYRAASGLLVPSVTNTPRIEYGPGGEVFGLLMEASRTNLCLRSQEIDNASWTKTAATISADAIAAPDGTTTADKLAEDATSNRHSASQTFAKAASVLAYTASVWVKAAERTQAVIVIEDGVNEIRQWYNLSTVAVGTSTSVGGAETKTGATITAYANGWYRLTLSITSAALATLFVIIGAADADASYVYSGTNGSGIYVWGAQLEQAAFPSSYIPTTTVSVARTADSCIRTLASEFSATAGSVVVAGRASGGQDAVNAQSVFEFNDASANNRIVLLRPVTGDQARYSMFTAGAQQGPLDGTFSNSTAFKAGITWQVNDLAYSFNGAAATTDTSATIPAITKLEIGSATIGVIQGNCHIRTFKYEPSRKPNAYLVDNAA